MFINRYILPNIIKDCANFLKKIKKLKLYKVGFDQNRIIKLKIYLFDCIVEKLNHQSIIIILNNKYIFFTNYKIWKTWI